MNGIMGAILGSLGGLGQTIPGEADGVEPTNNATEQAIRHVVIDRRLTQGTRSWWGMRFCERAWTVAATCRLHNQSVFQFFYDALLATFGDTPYPVLILENR